MTSERSANEKAMDKSRLSKVEGDGGTYVYDVAEGARRAGKVEGDEPSADRLWTQLVEKTVAALTLERGDVLVLRISPDTDAETFDEFNKATRAFAAESGVDVLITTADDMAVIRAEHKGI